MYFQCVKKKDSTKEHELEKQSEEYYEQRIKELEDKNKTLEKELNIAKGNTSEFSFKKISVENFEKISDTVLKEVEKTKESNVHLIDDNKNLQDIGKAVQDQIAKLLNENKKVKDTNNCLQKQNIQLKFENEQTENITEQLSQLNKKLNEDKSQLQESSNLLKNELKQIHKDYLILQKKVHVLEESLKSAKTQLQVLSGDYNLNKIQFLEETTNNLTDRNEALDNDLLQLNLDMLIIKQENRALQNINKEQNEKIENMKEEPSQLEKHHKNGNENNFLKNFNKCLNVLNNKVKTLENEIVRIKKEKSNVNLEEFNKVLKEKIGRLQKTINKQEQIKSDLEQTKPNCFHYESFSITKMGSQCSSSMSMMEMAQRPTIKNQPEEFECITKSSRSLQSLMGTGQQNKRKKTVSSKEPWKSQATLYEQDVDHGLNHKRYNNDTTVHTNLHKCPERTKSPVSNYFKMDPPPPRKTKHEKVIIQFEPHDKRNISVCPGKSPNKSEDVPDQPIDISKSLPYRYKQIMSRETRCRLEYAKQILYENRHSYR